MVCSNCKTPNSHGALKCRHCGARLAKIPVSRITVNLPKADESPPYEEGRAGMPKAMLAFLLAAGVLVIATIVVLLIIFVSNPAVESFAADAEPIAEETLEPTPEPTPEPTLVSTPALEPDDEFDIVFERPKEGLLPDLQ